MTFNEFKAAYGVVSFSLWPTKSPDAKSEYAGRAISRKHGEISMCSKNKQDGGYKPDPKNTYFYPTDIEVTDEETGEVTKQLLVVLSNNAGKAPAISSDMFNFD